MRDSTLPAAPVDLTGAAIFRGGVRAAISPRGSLGSARLATWLATAPIGCWSERGPNRRAEAVGSDRCWRSRPTRW
jgi:hypothetical protein